MFFTAPRLENYQDEGDFMVPVFLLPTQQAFTSTLVWWTQVEVIFFNGFGGWSSYIVGGADTGCVDIEDALVILDGVDYIMDIVIREDHTEK